MAFSRVTFCCWFRRLQ